MILAQRNTALYTSIDQRSKGLYMLIQIISLINGRPAGKAQKSKQKLLKVFTYFNSICYKSHENSTENRNTVGEAKYYSALLTNN